MTYFYEGAGNPTVAQLRDNTSELLGSTTVVYPTSGIGSFWFEVDSASGEDRISALPDFFLFNSDDTSQLYPDASLAGMTILQVAIGTRSGLDQVLVSQALPDQRLIEQYNQNDGSFIDFHQIVGDLPPPRSVGGINYLDEYYLGVFGGTPPYGLDNANPGRVLITQGEPTGERDAAWGSWVDVVGSTDPIDLPPEVAWDTDVRADGTARLASPGYEYDDASGEWRLSGVDLGSIPAEDLRWVAGRGLEALREGASSALADIVDETVDQIGEDLGVGRLLDVLNNVERARELYDTNQGFYERAFALIDEATRDFANNPLSLKEYEQRSSSLVNDYTHDLADQLPLPDWASQIFTGIRILRSNSTLTYSAELGQGQVRLAEHNDTMLGTAATDRIDGGAGNDILLGLGGTDILAGADGNDGVFGHSGNDSLLGGRGRDVVHGGRGLDVVRGGDEADSLYGGTENDTMYGERGADLLVGGTGKDTQTGGLMADRFDFDSNGEAGLGAARDVILDFSHSQLDRIDLTTIDARTGVSGDQAFRFIGTAAFSANANGQLRVNDLGSTVVLQGSTDADRAAEFEIELRNFTTSVVSSDFVL